MNDKDYNSAAFGVELLLHILYTDKLTPANGIARPEKDAENHEISGEFLRPWNREFEYKSRNNLKNYCKRHCREKNPQKIQYKFINPVNNK